MALTPDQRKTARTLIRKYLEQAIANKGNIHYSQIRPTMLAAPTATFWTDCSGLVINAFRWADMWTHFLVKDPAGYGYTGIGNTQSILVTNHKRRVPLERKFFVGDMALFGTWGDTEHVIICMRNGDAQTSIWASHGREAGPEQRSLFYRGTPLVVVRSESLA